MIRFQISSLAIQVPFFNSNGYLTGIKNPDPFIISLTMKFCIRNDLIIFNIILISGESGEVFLESSSICQRCGAGYYTIVKNSHYCLECPKNADLCPGGD